MFLVPALARSRALQLTAALVIALAAFLPIGCHGDDDDADAAMAGSGGAPDVDLDGGYQIDLEEPLADAGTLPYACVIGVMDGVEKRFAELEPGGAIPIGGTGQAGLTARLAVRCTPSGDQPMLDMASIDLLLTNPFTAITAPRVARPRGYNMTCGDDGACVAVPILVEISHLAKLPQLEGLPIRVDLSVRSLADDTLLGIDRNHGVFERQ
jgi:hypothetical protein